MYGTKEGSMNPDLPQPKTYPERWLYLHDQLENDLEERSKWLKKQEIGGLKENGLSLMDAHWYQGYLTAIRDTLDTMKVLVEGSGKATPPSGTSTRT